MAFSTIGTPSSLSPDDADQLHATAKWARLVAILGFVFLGLLLLMGFTMGPFIARIMAMNAAMTGQPLPMDPTMLGLLYGVLFLVAVIIYFFPTLFLYQYATRTLRALRGGFDAVQYSKSLVAQHSLFTYLGVLMAIVVGLYAIGAVIIGITVCMLPDIPVMDPGQVGM